MKQSKHTPGPWVLIDGDRFSKEKVITTTRRIEDSYGCICDMDVYFSGQMGVEQEANARLIAAAPELLEALKAAQKKGSRWHPADPVVQQINVAIAKATGA